MLITLLIIAILAATLSLLVFSTLNYALRDFSRLRLEEVLRRANRPQLLDPTVEHAGDLALATSALRLAANVLVLVLVLRTFFELGWQWPYAWAAVVTLALTLLTSMALPHAAARYAGEEMIGAFAPALQGLYLAAWPLLKVTAFIDASVRRLSGASERPPAQQIEEEILSVVEEGQKDGVVDGQERAMIESVIEFRDAHVGKIMTPRVRMAALDVNAPPAQVLAAVAESAYSRLPVYDGTLDRVVGMLYARDLLRYVGNVGQALDIRAVMRPAFFVPESKRVRDLLEDFRRQKVHIAVVLDEYGGTAGLVTMEDILEELVGEIDQEHAAQPASLKRIDDRTFEADAAIPIDQLNRLAGLSLAEDAGYETLGGFVSTTLGCIPAAGAKLDHNGARFTVLEAEPTRVKRVKIEAI